MFVKMNLNKLIKLIKVTFVKLTLVLMRSLAYAAPHMNLHFFGGQGRGYVRAKVRGWVTGLDHNIFRYLVTDFLECWVKVWTRVL